MHCSLLIAFFGHYSDCDWIWKVPISGDFPTLAEYLLTFALTILLESPFYTFLLRKAWPNFWLNFASHPFLVWVMKPWLSHLGVSFGMGLLIIESLAILIEVIVLIKYYKVSTPKAFFTAASANLFSWNLGIWFYTLYLGI